MAQIQAIKRRIKSVGSTAQITKAMELVSASKMRRAIESMFQARPYAAAGSEVLSQLTAVNTGVEHALLNKRPIRKELIIAIASDRGLAGAYNSNISRMVLEQINHNREENIQTSVITVGQKLSQFIARIVDVELLGAYAHWSTEPTSTDIRPINQTAIHGYSQSQFDSVVLVYTDFISMLKQNTVVRPLLPLTIPENHNNASAETIFEPSTDEVLKAILPRLIEAQIFQAILEATASEHAARMMAMKNASDNAESLIDDLTLTYNGVRQASITQELAEITSGAEATK
jgi:F-type H+-transporting ATPase subunit gamma